MSNERFLGQKDLENEITELEEKLKIRKEQLEKLRLVNENGKYVLTSTGEILELNLEIHQDTWEKAINQNNTFKTRKDAEKERYRRALLYEFNQFKNECNNGWEPDWKDSEMKWDINYKGGEGVRELWTNNVNSFSIFGYFKSRQDARRAVEKFGDRIKKLYID